MESTFLYVQMALRCQPTRILALRDERVFQITFIPTRARSSLKARKANEGRAAEDTYTRVLLLALRKMASLSSSGAFSE